MLHALGISNTKSGDYTQPNKRYNPYPTSYRNYYQVEDCETWNELVNKGYAVKSVSMNLNYYFVTVEGKKYLKELGYKWHEKCER